MGIPKSKLAILGIVLLLIGFSPKILATVKIDTVPPDIDYTYPYGTYDEPNSLTLGETITLVLDSPSPDVDSTSVTCIVWPQALPPEEFTSVALTQDPDLWGHYTGSYTITYDCMHSFNFCVWDLAGNKSTYLAYGEVGDADGDFYLKDGNDFDYTLVSKDAKITFNHNDIYFKFVPTDKPDAITRVYIDIVDVELFDLSETVDDVEWNGTSRTLPDGTYTINGYFKAYGKTYKGLSILVGENEEPEPPSEWSTYDYLKILGVALIVIGLITKR